MPEETFENPQPTESKPTNWPEIILATVLGFGLLAGASYAGYWYGVRQTSLPLSATGCTANWTTYTNEDNSYSLKYPEDAYSLYIQGGVVLQHCPGEKERYGECGAPGPDHIGIYFYDLDPLSEKSYDEQLKILVEPPECIKEDPRTYQYKLIFKDHEWFVAEYFLDALSKKMFCSEEYLGTGYQKDMVTEHNGRALVVSISNASCGTVAGLQDVINTLEFLD